MERKKTKPPDNTVFAVVFAFECMDDRSEANKRNTENNNKIE